MPLDESCLPSSGPRYNVRWFYTQRLCQFLEGDTSFVALPGVADIFAGFVPTTNGVVCCANS